MYCNHAIMSGLNYESERNITQPFNTDYTLLNLLSTQVNW